MNLTRGIALCALTLAIALAIGAISPIQPYASAHPDPIIIIATPALAIVPLATPAPQAQPVEAQPVELPQAQPVEAQPVEAQPVELWAAYNANPLPEVHCPCDAVQAREITEQERAYSRARTR